MDLILKGFQGLLYVLCHQNWYQNTQIVILYADNKFGLFIINITTERINNTVISWIRRISLQFGFVLKPKRWSVVLQVKACLLSCINYLLETFWTLWVRAAIIDNESYQAVWCMPYGAREFADQEIRTESWIIHSKFT